MPRRRTNTEVGIAVYGLLAIALVVMGVFTFIFNLISDNPWILWVLLFVAAIATIAIAAGWFYARKQKLIREEAAEAAAAEARKRAEEERITAILEHKGEWGDAMCQWLIDGRYSLTDRRTAAIMNNFATAGQEKCQKLLERIIAIGDSSDMVKLALGEPTSVDEKLVTEKENKFRWIYGVPRRGATYIWFKNSKVTKIKT